jgi:sigma-B regulation protein RsbU (phosphoserine phosphatase)
LGLLDAAEYSAHDIHMESGDILVVFSDGLTEAENEYGNFFGQQRLLSLLENCRPLTASEAGKKILSDVFQFCGEAEQHDDITFAVIKKL